MIRDIIFTHLKFNAPGKCFDSLMHPVSCTCYLTPYEALVLFHVRWKIEIRLFLWLFSVLEAV